MDGCVLSCERSGHAGHNSVLGYFALLLCQLMHCKGMPEPAAALVFCWQKPEQNISLFKPGFLFMQYHCCSLQSLGIRYFWCLAWAYFWKLDYQWGESLTQDVRFCTRCQELLLFCHLEWSERLLLSWSKMLLSRRPSCALGKSVAA